MLEKSNKMKNFALKKVENYLNQVHIELGKCDLPEKEIIAILDEFRSHVNGRLGELFLQKSQINEEDLEQVFTELGKPGDIAADYLQISATSPISDQKTISKKKIEVGEEYFGDKTKQAIYIFFRVVSAIILSFYVLVVFYIIITSQGFTEHGQGLTKAFFERYSVILAIFSVFLINETIIKQKNGEKLSIVIKFEHLLNSVAVFLFTYVLSIYFIQDWDYNEIYYLCIFFLVVTPYITSILVLKRPYIYQKEII